MKYWSTKRKSSLVIHSFIASIILAWSLDASVTFWQSLYKDDIFAYGTVAVVDCMTLLGMILFILKINSPIQWLRHLLPFVSVLPLWSELQTQFAQLDSFYQFTLTAIVTTILVGLAWLIWHTIENLFIDPIEAAGEAFQSQLDVVGRTLLQMKTANDKLKGFADEYITIHKTEDMKEHTYNNIKQLPDRSVPTKVGNFVYFIMSPDGVCKIGKSSDVGSRLRAMKTSSHLELRLVHFIETYDSYILENRLHNYYKSQNAHIRGEWFKIDNRELEIIISYENISSEEDIEDLVFKLQTKPQPALTEGSQDDYLDAYNANPDAVIIAWKDEQKVSFEEIGRRLQITRQSATARYNQAKNRRGESQ